MEGIGNRRSEEVQIFRVFIDSKRKTKRARERKDTDGAVVMRKM